MQHKGSKIKKEKKKNPQSPFPVKLFFLVLVSIFKKTGILPKQKNDSYISYF